MAQLNNICEVCKKKDFVYEKKVVDEIFFLCEDCDWPTEDIEAANKLGEILLKIILEENNGKL